MQIAIGSLKMIMPVFHYSNHVVFQCNENRLDKSCQIEVTKKKSLVSCPYFTTPADLRSPVINGYPCSVLIISNYKPN